MTVRSSRRGRDRAESPEGRGRRWRKHFAGLGRGEVGGQIPGELRCLQEAWGLLLGGLGAEHGGLELRSLEPWKVTLCSSGPDLSCSWGLGIKCTRVPVMASALWPCRAVLSISAGNAHYSTFQTTRWNDLMALSYRIEYLELGRAVPQRKSGCPVAWGVVVPATPQLASFIGGHASMSVGEGALQ